VPAQMAQARAQQRVGQQPHAPDLEEHGGVADPGEALVVARHSDIVPAPQATRITPRG
jgi:hypothetical protein